ncbi:MAG TPA: carboxypeptidase-like regulatory domain-containing protein [Pyrinomonadaceae bacterium]|nr:carboxypeptidase-like regulatory domain-containing protein [Pyrinomonadaceae bacterium]
MKTTSSSRSVFFLKAVISSRSLFAASLVLMLTIFFASSANAQVGFSAIGSTYNQNFDDMGSGSIFITDDITGSLIGFHALREFGNANPNFVQADDGSETTGNFKNYGYPLHFDRALGVLPDPSTGGMRLGLRFVNDTIVPIFSLQVTFTAEQWRNGGNQTPHSLVFAYRKDTSVNDMVTGVYTVVPALEFTTPNVGPIAGPLDGNDPANRETLTATFAVTIMPGEEIMLRWESLDAFGDDHGIAIDDLSVTPFGASTAADVTLSGRVTDSSGRGIAKTRVVLSGGMMTEPAFALTNAFGYYTFEGVESGQSYFVRVETKKYRFENPVLFLNLGDSFTGADFVAMP